MTKENEIPGIDSVGTALVCEEDRRCQAVEEATTVGMDETQPFYPLSAHDVIDKCRFRETGRCALVTALVHTVAEKGSV